MLIDPLPACPIFRGVVAGLVCDFLNRVRVRLSHLRVIVVPEDTGGGVLALDAHGLSQSGGEGITRNRSAQPVDSEQAAGGIITHARKRQKRVVGIAVAGCAGVDGSDAQQRELVQLLDGDIVSHVAGFGFQQRSFGLRR